MLYNYNPKNGAGSRIILLCIFPLVLSARLTAVRCIYRATQTMILFLLLTVTRCVGFLVTPVIIIITETRVFRINTTGFFFSLLRRCSSLMTGPACFYFLLFYLIVNFSIVVPSKHASQLPLANVILCSQ